MIDGPDPLPFPAPPAGATWVGLSASPLPSATISAWAHAPDCGAVVTFTGAVRDHAPDRPGVAELTYEAYLEHAGPRIDAVVAELRERWPSVRRVAALHRVGRLVVGDVAVVVAAGSAHRADAFAAAAFCIDEIKATVPIWKHERWADGEGWGSDAAALRDRTGRRNPSAAPVPDPAAAG